MKIFKKNYVGINHTRKDTTTAPLAFLTPYEDNVAGKKRQESVNSWLHPWNYQNKARNPSTHEIKTVDNKPMTGFKVVDFAERYSTSNKLARIYDPNGYELEISIPNLIDIMLHSSIVKGEIMCECIWGRADGNNWLLPTDIDAYKSALHEGKILKAEIDDIVIGAHSKRYVYLGEGYVQHVAICGPETYSPSPRGSWDFDGSYTIKPEFIGFHNSNKKRHLYYCIGGNVWDKDYLVTRVKPMKIQGLDGKSDFDYDDTTVFKLETWVYHTADGESFAEDRDGAAVMSGDDPHRHYSYHGRISESPFDNTPPPFDAVKKNIDLAKA